MTYDHETMTMAAKATLHCATGCVLGEVTGLMIGVGAGLGVWATMGLATALAFLFGLTLASVPLARAQGITIAAALGMIWLGEVTSIAAMEVAMNATDYALGGVGVTSLANPLFWTSLLAAIPVGYLAALPVNYVMIRRGIGHHHH
jgi:hypothetical protein